MKPTIDYPATFPASDRTGVAISITAVGKKAPFRQIELSGFGLAFALSTFSVFPDGHSAILKT